MAGIRHLDAAYFITVSNPTVIPNMEKEE